MNLSEAIKFVLKTKTSYILVELFKNDLRHGLNDLYKEMTISELKASSFEALKIMRHLPFRVKEGFTHFGEDVIHEFAAQADSKSKAIFCLKLVTAIFSFILGAIYGVRGSSDDKRMVRDGWPKSSFGNLLVTEIAFTMSRHFILHFLREIEAAVTNPEDLRKVRSFKQAFDEAQLGNTDSYPKFEEGHEAFKIVDTLKNYLMNGRK